MAQLFEIKKVTIGPKNLEAVVEVAPSAPLMTSDDPEGTGLVLDLIPELVDHVCLGDAAPHFGEVVEDTELAHLLEHVTVELLARTDVAGDVSSGQTTGLGERAYKITFLCPDDVLVAGALSSAAWILQWAYSGGGEPEPDVDAIASGLVDLVDSLGGTAREDDEAELEPEAEPEVADEGEKDAEPEVGDDAEVGPDGASDAEADDEPDGAEAEAEADSDAAEPEDDDAADAAEPEVDADAADANKAPASNAWNMDDVPRPHFVR